MPREKRKLQRTEDEQIGDTEQPPGINHSVPSKRSKNHAPSPRDPLCKRCAKIDLDKVLSRQHKTCVGQAVKNLGPISAWEMDSCALCGLLASTLPPRHRSRTNKTRYVLRSYSTIKSNRAGLKSIDIGMIGLEQSDIYLIPQHQGSTWLRTLKPDHIDFEIIKNWLNLCRGMHTSNCAAKTPSIVPFMKLIDCDTGDIVPAASQPYVALSYVCGADLKPVGYCESLPKDLPATIEDAVTVTRQLGFRYLWIDQFCIDQRRKDDLTAQLLTMDSIYRNSDLTIIAGAGQDATYGLPGVGKRHRAAHSSSLIKRHFFVSSLSDPKSLIGDTTWITRAWTYQEGILSRRRLVFTDEQVYYECHGMHCCEVFDFPLRDMHTKSQQRLKIDFCAGDNIGIFPRGVGRNPWEVLERIEEYSSKSLTKPSDILNAVLGILRAFEDGAFKIRHCLGVPILPQPRRKSRTSSETDHTSVAPSWKPVMGLFMGLCWSSTFRSSRRIGFPSWSWAGWLSPVKWDTSGIEKLHIDPNINVEFELEDGRIINYDAFQSSYSALNRSLALSNYTHISAWTSPITLLGRHSRGGYEARVDLEDGCFLHWRFEPTTNKELSTDLTYLGIHMGYQILDELSKTGPALMVVANFESGMERVAFGWVDQSNYDYFEADGALFRTEALRTNPLSARIPKLAKSWQKIRLS